MKTIEWISEAYPECMKMDGYDDCILGICHRFGAEPSIAYDKSKVIRNLMSDGMSEEDAEDFFGFNQLGARVGDSTPVFIETMCDSVVVQENPVTGLTGEKMGGVMGAAVVTGDIRKIVREAMVVMIDSLASGVLEIYPTLDRDKLEVFLLTHIMHLEEVDDYVYEVIDDFLQDREVSEGSDLLKKALGEGVGP